MGHKQDMEKGEALFADGQIDDAKEIFELILRDHPENGEVLNNLGVLHHYRGNFKKAEDYLLKALSVKENYPDALLNLANLYQDAKRWKEAAIRLEEYISIDNQDPDVFNRLGMVYLEMGNTEKARGVLAISLDLNPDQEAVRDSLKALENKRESPRIEVTERPLNILFVQESPCIRNYKMATALRSRGHKVSLAYTKARLSQMYKGLSDDVYDECIQLQSHRHLWDISKNYDIVHCHNEPDVLTVAALAGDAPVVHDTHDLISLRANGNPNLSYFEGVANRGAAGRVYTTPYQLEEAKRLYGVGGPSLVFFNYASEADLPKRFLPKLSDQDGQVHIVYEGGIGGNGHRDFSSLFIELGNQGIHIHIYPTFYDQEIAKYFSGYQNIHYCRPLSPKEVMQEMTQYDFGIIPFNLEKGNRRFLDSTIANKLFEYLAAGLPVIASSLKSYINYFERNPVGITFESSEAIINNIAKLKQIAKRTDFSTQIFTFESKIAMLEEFYHGVVTNSLPVRTDEKSKEAFAARQHWKERGIPTCYFKEGKSRDAAVRSVAVGRRYCQEICKREYESQRFVMINERPIEYRFVFQALSRIAPIMVLDIGTGTTSLPNLMRHCGFVVTATDNIRDYWPKGTFNRHFYVINDDITNTQITSNFDLITCVSLLEHIRNYDAAVQSMFNLLNPGGHLVLTFPYNEKLYVENVYKLPGVGYGQNYPYICQIFSRNEIDRWLKKNNGRIFQQEYWQIYSGDLWAFGDPLNPPRQVDKDERHQLTCILIQKKDIMDEPTVRRNVSQNDELEAERRHPDRVSQVYMHEIPWHEPTKKAIIARINTIVQEAAGDVLDVGCSDGITSILIAKKGLKVTGIDMLQEHIDRANRELKKKTKKTQDLVTFQQGWAEHLCFADQTFDTVILGQVIEHVVDERVVLKEASRVLKSNGLMLCSAPVGRDDTPTHKRWFTPGSFDALMGEFFSDVKIINFGPEMLAIARGDKMRKPSIMLKEPVQIDVDGGQKNKTKAPSVILESEITYHTIHEINLIESQWWDRQTLIDHQEIFLRDFIKHCYANVPFWRSEMKKRGLTPRDIQHIDDLSKLPFTDKAMMKDNPQFIASNASGFASHWGHTGGSTGRPFKYLVSKQQYECIAAAVQRGWGWAGWKPGDRILTMSGYGLGSAPDARLYSVGMNEEIMDDFIKKIREFKPDGYRGIPYPMNLFCKHLEKRGIGVELRKKYTLTTSENLFIDQRERITKYLGEVFDHYGANDGGSNAMECEEHSGLHISEEIAVMEIIDKEEKVLTQGNAGVIVVTNLFNYAMPWLRYRSNDVGTISENLCKCGRGLPLLIDFKGRETDFIVTENAILSGTALCDAINHLPMRSYQFIQDERNHITVKICKEEGYSNKDTETILKQIRDYDPKVEVDFEFVDDILLTDAGKSKYVVNLIDGWTHGKVNGE